MQQVIQAPVSWLACFSGLFLLAVSGGVQGILSLLCFPQLKCQSEFLLVIFFQISSLHQRRLAKLSSTDKILIENSFKKPRFVTC